MKDTQASPLEWVCGFVMAAALLAFAAFGFLLLVCPIFIARLFAPWERLS